MWPEGAPGTRQECVDGVRGRWVGTSLSGVSESHSERDVRNGEGRMGACLAVRTCTPPEALDEALHASRKFRAAAGVWWWVEPDERVHMRAPAPHSPLSSVVLRTGARA